MVEEKFEIWLFETTQNGLILLFSVVVTIVEENFVIWVFETTQNGLILLFSVVVIS